MDRLKDLNIKGKLPVGLVYTNGKLKYFAVYKKYHYFDDIEDLCDFVDGLLK